MTSAVDLLSIDNIYADRITTQKREEVKQKMLDLMYEPLTDEEEIQATLHNRIGKGFANDFLKGLDKAFQTYKKENPNGHFIVPLNEREGAAFFGKNTDSLYTTLHSAIKRNGGTEQWRLVRIKKGDDSFLRIVRV